MYERTTTKSRREAEQANRRYFRTSCEAYMVANPKHTPETPLPPHMQTIPYIGPGTTYTAGKNQAKRVRRAFGG